MWRKENGDKAKRGEKSEMQRIVAVIWFEGIFGGSVRRKWKDTREEDRRTQRYQKDQKLLFIFTHFNWVLRGLYN